MNKRLLIALCLICLANPVLAAGRGYFGVWFGPIPSTETEVQTGVMVKKVTHVIWRSLAKTT